MAEFVAALLDPLRGIGIVPVQESLGACSVVALPHGVEAGSHEAGFQSAAEGGRLDVPNLFPGANHWAAASLQGAGHLLAVREAHATGDVRSPGEDTLAEARDRYFISSPTSPRSCSTAPSRRPPEGCPRVRVEPPQFPCPRPSIRNNCAKRLQGFVWQCRMVPRSWQAELRVPLLRSAGERRMIAPVVLLKHSP